MPDYAHMMHNYTKTHSASIVGARGYSGLELARILLRHPSFGLTHCFATSDFNLEALLNSDRAAGVVCLQDQHLMQNLTDVVFLATPAEVSLKLAPKIMAAGKKVVDLSGAFRLKQNDYSKWYGFEHTEKALLGKAHYGLVPWAAAAKNDAVVANPGCFATAISMALLPLLRDQLVLTDNLVIDAKSGSSGAGKKAAENLLFTEIDGECLPYKVGGHQHHPEINEAAELLGGAKIDAHFATSLLPVRRGIIAAIFATLKPGKILTDVEASFAKAYRDYPLVKFGTTAEAPALVSLKKVVGTARTHISYTAVGNKLYVFSCIDNLMKGAASQAVENANRLFDFPIETGLLEWEAMT